MSFHFPDSASHNDWSRRQSRMETPIVEKRSDQPWRCWLRRCMRVLLREPDR